MGADERIEITGSFECPLLDGFDVVRSVCFTQYVRTLDVYQLVNDGNESIKQHVLRKTERVKMRPTTKRIHADILTLMAVPTERRAQDWRIAQGLLVEAAQYIKIGNDLTAETMRKAAAPYLRFAELN